MKFKRAGAAALAAVLSATSMGVYAFAEEDQKMKTEMTYVKQRIDIPESYSDFSYRTQTDYNSTKYVFTWSRKSETSGNVLDSITVGITGKVIKSVNIAHNTYLSDYYEDKISVPENGQNEWSASFAKMSDSKLLAAAKKYIKQINPTIYENIVIDEDSFSISLWGQNANLSFHRTANGLPVTGETGSVIVNKDTGELVNYNFQSYVNGATFSETKDTISVEDAQKAYMKLFPVELVYTLDYDWQDTRTYTPHLVYRQTKNGQINAFTGELSTFDDYKSYDNGDDDVVTNDVTVYEEDADDANPGTGAYGAAEKEVTFSQAEIEKLELENKLIKADAALDKLKKDGIFYVPAVSEVQYQNCYYNEFDKAYYREVNFVAHAGTTYVDANGEGEVVPLNDITLGQGDNDVWGSFAINAETGDLKYFYCYAPDNKSGMDEKESTEKATEILKKILGDETAKHFGELSVQYSNKVYNKYDPNTGRGVGTPRITSISFNANRVENGITCVSEYASLTLANNGYVTSFSSEYHNDIEYPAPEKIISQNKAYKNFFKQVGLGHKYRCAYRTDTKKVVTALVYAADSSLYIDAFTGKRTDYNGKPITEAEETGNYTDLENSKYKKYAEKLQKYGITLMDKDGRLNENETITAADFCGLISWADLDSYIIGQNSEIKDDTKLTRRLAAYILVASKYGTAIPDMTGIFKSKFSDVSDTNKYAGYIMIADASGMLTGNGDKYSPKAAFTRGEAIKVLYDLLSK